MRSARVDQNTWTLESLSNQLLWEVDLLRAADRIYLLRTGLAFIGRSEQIHELLLNEIMNLDDELSLLESAYKLLLQAAHNIDEALDDVWSLLTLRNNKPRSQERIIDCFLQCHPEHREIFMMGLVARGFQDVRESVSRKAAA